MTQLKFPQGIEYNEDIIYSPRELPLGYTLRNRQVWDLVEVSTDPFNHAGIDGADFLITKVGTALNVVTSEENWFVELMNSKGETRQLTSARGVDLDNVELNISRNRLI